MENQQIQTFSQKMQRLEDIVAKLESPDIELEQGLALLEEGVALHKQCQTILTDSQAKITTLLKEDQVDEAGKIDSSVDQEMPLANQDTFPF